MAQDKHYARVQQKIDTTANWNKATNFRPLEGEIIVYQDDGDTVPKIKIGHADTPVSDLPFITEDIEADIDALTEATTDLVYYSDGNREAAVVPVNADTFNGQPPSYYATAEAVNNAQSTADTAKSTAETAKTTVDNHTSNKSNPHEVTKDQVGLSNVTNVQQMPISGGTFTGNVLAYSTNRTGECLRNITVRDTAGKTDQSTNFIQFNRK